MSQCEHKIDNPEVMCTICAGEKSLMNAGRGSWRYGYGSPVEEEVLEYERKVIKKADELIKEYLKKGLPL
jgi:hypothetical protein